MLDIYSSGLALLTAGLRVPRFVAALIDGTVMIAGTIYVVFFASNFVGQFEGFLITLGVPIAAWCGIMLADIALRRRDYAEADLYDPAGRYGDVRPFPIAVIVVGTVVGWGLVTNTAAELAEAGRATCSARSGWAARPAPGRSPTWACWSRWSLGFVVTLAFGRSAVRAQESASGAGSTPGMTGSAAAAGWRSSTCSGCSPSRAARGSRRGSPRSSARSRELVAAFRPPGHVHQVRRARGARPGRGGGTTTQWPFALQPPDAPIYELVGDFAGRGPARRWTRPRSASGARSWRGRVGDGGRLVLAGVSTDCCVLSTAVAAADAGVAVQVVADACAGVTDDSHGQALAILRLYAPLVEVVSLATRWLAPGMTGWRPGRRDAA